MLCPSLGPKVFWSVQTFLIWVKKQHCVVKSYFWFDWKTFWPYQILFAHLEEYIGSFKGQGIKFVTLFKAALILSESDLLCLKVSKSQKHFFMKLHEVLDKILPYEAKAEFCQIFCLFFGQWSFKKKLLRLTNLYRFCQLCNIRQRGKKIDRCVKY